MTRIFLLGLALALAGCPFGGDGDAPATTRPLGLTCGMMNKVITQFGATMRGSSPFVLGAYVAFDAEGRTILRDPGLGTSGAGCSLQVLNNLENLCDAYLGRGVCGNPGDFDSCLVAVELAMTHDEGCALCGNGVCEGREAAMSYQEGTAEWFNNCPADCACGNARCEPEKGEHIYSCPTDCPAACGDGLCTGLEVCGACEDLPYRAPDDCSRCDADCCETACGDGVCRLDAGETRATCEQDCPYGFCGDDVCLGGEMAGNCADCFRGWTDHCLEPRCRDGGPCEDERATCGDGVCMGCEQWTCAADCHRAGHLPCLAGHDACPAGSCGDGACEHPVENAISCPLDCRWLREDDTPATVCDDYSLLHQPSVCVGDPEYVACGDGFCSYAETAASCADDCVPPPGRCVGTTECSASGRMCARRTVPGEVSGDPVTQVAIVSCGASCEVVEVCRDACVDDGDGPRCVDCSWINGELDHRACATDDAPRCVGDGFLSRCVDDPGNPGEPVCRLRVQLACTGACVDGACATDYDPCAWGACGTCGDDSCGMGETVDTCPGDCACRSACYFAGYDRDEAECPAAFAACNCGNDRCEDWERTGPWACPADCGGG